jgi:hypothetical protein
MGGITLDSGDVLGAAITFNNMNQVHGQQTDFNAITNFGVRYVQGSTNGPGISGATQYYGFSLGLGSNYPYSDYGSQFYWPRTGVGGLPYPSVRFREAGTWSAWSKIYAGFADAPSGATFAASGDFRAPIYYKSTNTGFYLDPYGSSNVEMTCTGVWYFQSNRNTSSNSAPLQAYSTGALGATMAFHRAGVFAVNMGLDSDNVFRIGGWSASNNLIQLDMSGNFTALGNVTAYSDIRMKKDVETIADALGLVRKMRGVTYTRIDTDKAGVGVIAQEMLEVMPQVVQQGAGDNDTLSVAYGNLVGVLIEAIKELEARVAELEGK